MLRCVLSLWQDPIHGWTWPGGSYPCGCIQVTISGITSRCQSASHQVPLNALTCSVSWSLPRWYTIEGAALLALVDDAAFQDAPWRLSHTCTCYSKGKHRDHSLRDGGSQHWYKGSYLMHSSALFAKRIGPACFSGVWKTAEASWCLFSHTPYHMSWRHPG